MQKTVLLVGLFALFAIAAAGEFRVLKELLDEAERGGSSEADKQKLDKELSADDIKNINGAIDYLVDKFKDVQRVQVALLLHIGINTDRLRQLNELPDKRQGGDPGHTDNKSLSKRINNLLNSLN